MNLDQQKSGEKSGKRKQKHSKKKEQKSAKSDQALVAKELIEAANPSNDTAETEAAVAVTAVEQTAAAVAPVEQVAPVDAAPAEDAAKVDAAPADPAPAEPVARVASFKERMASVMPPADTAPSKPPAPADVAPAVRAPAATPATGIQAIANVYRDYTRKSLEDAQSFAEKLAAARSLDKAVEAQAEYAQKACENFAADSRRIRELHRELFWQTFRLPYWPLGRTRP